MVCLLSPPPPSPGVKFLAEVRHFAIPVRPFAEALAKHRLKLPSVKCFVHRTYGDVWSDL